MIQLLVPLLLRHRRLVALLVLGITALAPVSLLRLEVDTNPENMLPADDPARVRTAELGAAFGAGRQLVVGLDSRQAVTPDELAATRALQDDVAALPGVVGDGVLGPAPSQPLSTTTQVRAAMDAIAAHPVLGGQLASSDGSLVTILVPLTDDADVSGLADEIRLMVAADPRLSGMRLALGGVPHAQEAFGAQMFVQMAVFAPLAALVIMALVWWHFRRARPVVAAMTLSMVTVLWTMGLLVFTGHTVHIMSSMIPIFLLPIGILDSIHVISEYDERVGETSRRDAITRVYEGLARPLTLTTLTTAVGFGSLALTPIPPVQTFGIFVAVGVVIAWALTMVLLPVLLAGMRPRAMPSAHSGSLSARLVRRTGGMAVRRRRGVIGLAGVVAVLALLGVTRLEVNDNPVQWFRSDHPVRQDAELLDRELAGTATLDLVLEGEPGAMFAPRTTRAVHRLAAELATLPQVGSVADFTRVSPGDPTRGMLVTQDGRSANVWLRLRGGDNRTTAAVVARAEQALARSGLPRGCPPSGRVRPS